MEARDPRSPSAKDSSLCDYYFHPNDVRNGRYCRQRQVRHQQQHHEIEFSRIFGPKSDMQGAVVCPPANLDADRCCSPPTLSTNADVTMDVSPDTQNHNIHQHHRTRRSTPSSGTTTTTHTAMTMAKTQSPATVDGASVASDSGIFSATPNSTFPDDSRIRHPSNGTATTNASSEPDSDNRSECSDDPDDDGRKYLCPICERMMTSQHEFTLHIRSHNTEDSCADTDNHSGTSATGGYTCRICLKVLSSSSSLDRHVLVHSGERPFTCKYCGDTFTTNGNMHRHMRTHKHHGNANGGDGHHYESDGSSDGGGSNSTTRSIEYNNNKIERHSSGAGVLGAQKRKLRHHLNDDESQHEADEESSPVAIVKRIKQEVATSGAQCPICDRDDFESDDSLAVHMMDNHPDYPAKCDSCHQVFKNYKSLNFHKTVVHCGDSGENGRSAVRASSINGFKDLTFVDFSSEKFPHIARYECEKNVHRATAGLKFQCSKCLRAFPCNSSLEIHEPECGSAHERASNGAIPCNELRRADFFSRLDLQDNSPEKQSPPSHVDAPLPTTKLQQRLMESIKSSIDTSKDLADIQTIISMTSNGSLLHPLQPTAKLEPMTMLTDHNNSLDKHEEEETQDVFAMEFRKMKLRGEFPCRLCTAVFPNLRALKGHNRSHLNFNSSGTYRCNMCPHSSVDKAALIRHMRTHNGDRPYECSLCNYAFTTKANCERHLRNRHMKSTREEVKKSIIYHPSEDPTNDEANKHLESTKKQLNSSMTSTDSNEMMTPEKVRVHSSTPKSAPFPASTDLMSFAPGLQVLKESLMLNSKEPKPYSDVQDIIYKENLKSLKEHRKSSNDVPPPISPFYPAQYNFAPRVSNTSTPHKVEPKIHVRSLNQLKEIPEVDDDDDEEDEYEQEQDVEAPLDLVLDLSKKTKPATDKVEELPQDLTKKPMAPSVSELAEQLLKASTPKIDPTALYASQLAFYRNTFPHLSNLTNWPPFPMSPLLFPSLQAPMIPQPDPQEIKDRLRLQLCGGGMIMPENFSEHLKSLYPSPMASPLFPAFATNPPPPISVNNDVKPENIPQFIAPPPTRDGDLKPLSVHIDTAPSTPTPSHMEKHHSPAMTQFKPDNIQSPNSIKMVIKNGILMPKQKQRRYRTERPFSCEHCSARFTLRSNMERHIKQQHPQYWSQRQRSGVGNPGRKTNPMQYKLAGGCDISVPSYELSTRPFADEDSDQQQAHITDKIKMALLTQRLKATVQPEHDVKISEVIDDDESDLVIDENEDDEDCARDEDEKIAGMKDRDPKFYESVNKTRILEEKLNQLRNQKPFISNVDKAIPSQQQQHQKAEESAQDLVPVSRLLDNASQQPFKEYFHQSEDVDDPEEMDDGDGSDEDEEGLVASGSTSEGHSGSDEKGGSEESEPSSTSSSLKKKSAYSMAPNRVSCPYCSRKFPWTSSLRRHVLTHTGQKPFKCSHCPLLFTTKSNCDRHLLRKHGNASTAPATIPTGDEQPSAANNYLMRNVPERPFKCATCVSSTFSTYSNLKKHMSSKHGSQDDRQGYEAGSSEDEKIVSPKESKGPKDKDDWENQIAHSKIAAAATQQKFPSAPANAIANASAAVAAADAASIGESSVAVPTSVLALNLQPTATQQQQQQQSNSDLPFKCHLCDSSFGERQDCLDHIRDHHSSEFDLLLSKNALDMNAVTPEDNNSNHEDEDERDPPPTAAAQQRGGKFPDYSNRKVICAFCMRRFWSAEDLRRHMRTHTGERPFSCDVCRRRFTLKHSMLRHRKKHTNGGFNKQQYHQQHDQPSNSDDESHNLKEDDVLPVRRPACSGSANAPGRKISTDESDGTEGNDLISNLLGIRDRSIIEQVLTASPDDAAKLLGVKKGAMMRE